MAASIDGWPTADPSEARARCLGCKKILEGLEEIVTHGCPDGETYLPPE